MKDTILPLDMIFIRASGVVDSIARDQQPFGLANTFSAGPVIAALEISAGSSDRLGLKAGDKVMGFGSQLPPLWSLRADLEDAGLDADAAKAVLPFAKPSGSLGA
jgi:hypothetical protein